MGHGFFRALPDFCRGRGPPLRKNIYKNVFEEGGLSREQVPWYRVLVRVALGILVGSKTSLNKIGIDDKDSGEVFAGLNIAKWVRPFIATGAEKLLINLIYKTALVTKS